MSDESILSEIRSEVRRNTAILEDIVLQLAELKNENANFRNELNNNRNNNNGSKMSGDDSIGVEHTRISKRGSNLQRSRSPKQKPDQISLIKKSSFPTINNSPSRSHPSPPPSSKLSQRKKQAAQDVRSASMPVSHMKDTPGSSLAAAAANSSSVHFFSNNLANDNITPPPNQHRKFSESIDAPSVITSGGDFPEQLDEANIHLHQNENQPISASTTTTGKHITFSNNSTWATSSTWNDNNEQLGIAKTSSPTSTSVSQDGIRWVRLYSPTKKNFFFINIDQLERPITKNLKTHPKTYANPVPTNGLSFGSNTSSNSSLSTDTTHHRIVWESADVGHHWESFFIADVGENMYVNTVTGEATFTRPEATIPKRTIRRRSSGFVSNNNSKSSLEDSNRGDTGDGSSGNKTENEMKRLDDDRRKKDEEEELKQREIASEKVDFDVSSVANLRAPKSEDSHQSKKITAIRQRNANGFKLGGMETRVKKRSNPWMFSPEGTKKLVWDFMVVFPMLMYLAVMTPFYMCFAWDPRRERNPNLVVFEALIDIVFILDICFNFRTGFINLDGDTEFDTYAVIKNYCFGWFGVDVVSAVPYGLLRLTLGVNEQENSWFGSVKILKLGRSARALRLFRFLKVSRLLKNLKILKTMDRDTIERIQDFVSHYGGRQNIMYMQDKAGLENWLHDGSYMAYTYKDTKGGKHVGSIYLAAFYFCMTTMTSVGYGDISPLNDSERAFTICLEAVGCVMYALIVAVLTSAIMSSDANARAIATRLESVTSYIKARGFSPVLARKLRLYFRHFYSEKMAIDEQEILKDLSTSLRMEVSTFLVSELMGQVSLFRLLSPVHWSMILPLLRPCRFTAYDFVCHQGDDCTDLFVILSGTCQSQTLPLAEKPTPPSQLASPSPSSASTSSSTSTSTLKQKKKKKSKRSKSVDTQENDEVKEDFPLSPSPKKESSGGSLGSVISRVVTGGAEEPEDWVVKRLIGAGDTVNALCLVGVWSKSIESVQCDDVVDAYGINCDEFRACFGDDTTLWKKLQRHVTYTMHEMLPDPEAPTEYGMPLHVLDAEEIAEREYELEMEERTEMSRRKDNKQKQLTESLERNQQENFELGYAI